MDRSRSDFSDLCSRKASSLTLAEGRSTSGEAAKTLWENMEKLLPCFRGTKRLVSVNICSVEGNSAGIFVS